MLIMHCLWRSRGTKKPTSVSGRWAWAGDMIPWLCAILTQASKPHNWKLVDGQCLLLRFRAKNQLLIKINCWLKSPVHKNQLLIKVLNLQKFVILSVYWESGQPDWLICFAWNNVNVNVRCRSCQIFLQNTVSKTAKEVTRSVVTAVHKKISQKNWVRVLLTW